MKDIRIDNLEAELAEKDFKLNSLLEITSAINSNMPVEYLMKIFLYILQDQLGFNKIVLFNHANEWVIQTKIGVKGSFKDFDVIGELGRFKEITFIHSSPTRILQDFQVVVPVFHNEKPLSYLLLRHLETHIQNNEKFIENLRFVQTLANIIVVAIENKQMEKQKVIQEQFEKELALASEMQQFLFPAELPSNRKMDIAAKYLAHNQVGGDYYDFIPIRKNEYIMCIGDVSGKGISAAMLMANFQATLRTLLILQKYELDFLVRELNEKVMQTTKGEKFITFFIAHFNAETRLMTYVNAGHNHPILTNGKEVKMLDQGTIGLGMFNELPFLNIGEVVLKPNTALISYTDGVVELENEAGEQFGLERLIKVVHSFYMLKMEDVTNLTFGKLDEWRTTCPFVDDTAILACRFF